MILLRERDYIPSVWKSTAVHTNRNPNGTPGGLFGSRTELKLPVVSRMSSRLRVDKTLLSEADL